MFDDAMFFTLWIIALVVWAGMTAARHLDDLEHD
jgi:hypothetical protein